jgi:hypothetical protein
MKSLWTIIYATLVIGLATAAPAQNLARATKEPRDTLHFVQYPGSNTTYLLGVSNNDIGVGWYYGSDGEQYGFILKNGSTARSTILMGSQLKSTE